MSASNCRTRQTSAQHHPQQQHSQQRDPVHSVQNQRYDQRYGATVVATGGAADEPDYSTEEHVGGDGRFVNANNCNEPTDYVVDDRGVDDVGSSMAGVATAGSCHQTTRSWHGMQAAPETKLSLRYVASEPHSVGKRNLVVTQAQVLIYMGTNFITCFVVHF
jgi:hypothetical protein